MDSLSTTNLSLETISDSALVVSKSKMATGIALFLKKIIDRTAKYA